MHKHIILQLNFKFIVWDLQLYAKMWYEKQSTFKIYVALNSSDSYIVL